MAERFVDAWARQDFNADARPSSAPRRRRSTPSSSSRPSTGRPRAAATATAINPGDADAPTSVDGVDVVDVRVDVRTELFGLIEGTVRPPGQRREDRLGAPPDLPQPADGRARRPPPHARPPRGDRRQGRDAPGRGRRAIATRRSARTRSTSPARSASPTTSRPRSSAQAGYPSDQETGVSGLELAFNSRLAGRPGGELLAVPEGTDLPDVPKSVEGRVLATAEQVPGQPVKTTIDPDLQEVTVSALGGRLGGIAVLDARNGQVRALAGAAFSNPRRPGSTFKVITTTAALDDNKVKLDDTFDSVTEINPAPQTGARVISNAHNEPCGGTFVDAFAAFVQHGLRPARDRGRRPEARRDRRALRLQPAADALQRRGDRGGRTRRDDDPSRVRRDGRPCCR